ncbi:MAG: hypothetical protein EPN22_15035 [Nitrospirae bacterium]|nr:MAG: hypothetical protein EPN22_15035 [Nitrospirota bacterium]
MLVLSISRMHSSNGISGDDLLIAISNQPSANSDDLRVRNWFWDESLSNKSGWYIDRNETAISGDATMAGGEVMNVSVERELVLC